MRTHDGSADLFVGAIAGTPFVGADLEKRIAERVTAAGEVVVEHDAGAYSFEVRAGSRYSLWSGSLRGENKGEIYGKADIGSVTCAASNSLCALGEVAIGVAARGGVLEGSSFEVGYGQTDLGFRKEPAAAVLDLYVTHPFGRIAPFVGVSGQRRSADAYVGISLSLR
ncbi:MAG: hypothetical protein NVSMB68_14760 [Thermoanaerobaculia bacterium]